MGKERDGSEGDDVGQDAAESPAVATTAAPASAQVVEPVAAPVAATVAPTRGNWRSQAGSKLFAELKPKFWVAGVLQVLLTLLQLAPYVLLVELARHLVQGSETGTLWTLGLWAVGLLALGAVLE